MQSDVDSKLELHQNPARIPSLREVLVIWVPLHCCAERGSSESRLWTRCDAIHIKTGPSGRGLWRCLGINTVKFCTHITSASSFIRFPSHCLALLGGGGCDVFSPAAVILQLYVRQVGCQVWPCWASISLLALCARMKHCLLYDWLTHWKLWFPSLPGFMLICSILLYYIL